MPGAPRGLSPSPSATSIHFSKSCALCRREAISMWLIRAALHRPITVVVLVMAVALCSILAVLRMRMDIFPNLNLPVIYVAQPYGGMDPAQMEGLLTNYYEYHFLYISNIHHVESRNVQGMALMKLSFHPGTNMAQAMAETIGYVTR